MSWLRKLWHFITTSKINIVYERWYFTQAEFDAAVASWTEPNMSLGDIVFKHLVIRDASLADLEVVAYDGPHYDLESQLYYLNIGVEK